MSNYMDFLVIEFFIIVFIRGHKPFAFSKLFSRKPPIFINIIKRHCQSKSQLPQENHSAAPNPKAT